MVSLAQNLWCVAVARGGGDGEAGLREGMRKIICLKVTLKRGKR